MRRHLRFDEITVTRYDWRQPLWRDRTAAPIAECVAGSLGWDSKSGKLWGTLADSIRKAAKAAQRRRKAWTRHPMPGGWMVRIRHPLHRPGKLAVILDSLGFDVPEILHPFLEQKLRRHIRAQGKFDRRMRASGVEVVY